MKENSKLALLALFQPENLDFELTQVSFELIWPRLVERGRTSLLYYLVSRGWLERRGGGREARYSLTAHGARLLREELPILTALTSRRLAPPARQLLVFVHSPSTDPQFRSLRRQLLEVGAIGLGRGAYLLLSELPYQLRSKLEQEYSQAVILLTSPRWQLGEHQITISLKKASHDLKNILSGVSKESTHLLSQNRAMNKWSPVHKRMIMGLYERYFALITHPNTRSLLALENHTISSLLLRELQKIQLLLAKCQ